MAGRRDKWEGGRRDTWEEGKGYRGWDTVLKCGIPSTPCANECNGIEYCVGEIKRRGHIGRDLRTKCVIPSIPCSNGCKGIEYYLGS